MRTAQWFESDEALRGDDCALTTNSYDEALWPVRIATDRPHVFYDLGGDYGLRAYLRHGEDELAPHQQRNPRTNGPLDRQELHPVLTAGRDIDRYVETVEALRDLRVRVSAAETDADLSAYAAANGLPGGWIRPYRARLARSLPPPPGAPSPFALAMQAVDARRLEQARPVLERLQAACRRQLEQEIDVRALRDAAAMHHFASRWDDDPALPLRPLVRQRREDYVNAGTHRRMVLNQLADRFLGVRRAMYAWLPNVRFARTWLLRDFEEAVGLLEEEVGTRRESARVMDRRLVRWRRGDDEWYLLNPAHPAVLLQYAYEALGVRELEVGALRAALSARQVPCALYTDAQYAEGLATLRRLYEERGAAARRFVAEEEELEAHDDAFLDAQEEAQARAPFIEDAPFYRGLAALPLHEGAAARPAWL